jgi:UDPglucose--hexose-1-phosphate uridylyltransferase
MEISSSLKFYRQRNQCIFCNLMDENLSYQATIHDKNQGEFLRELHVADYFVDQNDGFIGIKPFASRYPWEIHVLPRKHCHDFRNISDRDCGEIASLVRRIMVRLENVLGPVQYNYFLHSAPGGGKSDKYKESFHWHFEICPRTSIPNGFEIGSGLAVNTVSPEKAAILLRKAL